MNISFTIPGRPIGKGRPRVTQHGTFTPKETKQYEDLTLRCYLTQCHKAFPENVPLFIGLRAWFLIPKRTSKKRAAIMDGTYRLSKPDEDNLLKIVQDALNGHAYHDDSVIMCRCADKLWTTGAPRMDVILADNEDDVFRWMCK